MKKSSGGDQTHSAIEQNKTHIKELFKKVERRDARLEHNLKTNRVELMRKMNTQKTKTEVLNRQLLYEEEQIKKLGIQLETANQDGGKKLKKPVVHIDSGLSETARQQLLGEEPKEAQEVVMLDDSAKKQEEREEFEKEMYSRLFQTVYE